MSAYFLGGSAGGAIAATLYPAWGWTGVCAAGGVLALTGLALWASDRSAGQAPAATTSLPRPVDAAPPAGVGSGTS
jgi:hypothetical protein